MKAQQSARMEATQAVSLTNVCEGGDECNTGVRSEEPRSTRCSFARNCCQGSRRVRKKEPRN